MLLRSMQTLTDELHMLSGLCVAYGTSTQSVRLQTGNAQEVALLNGKITPHVRMLGDNALFDLASLTKLFTCIALMQLVDQGKLRLDEKIGEIDSRFVSLRDVSVYDAACYLASLQTEQRIDSAPTREEGLCRVFATRIGELPHIRIYSDMNALILKYVIEARANRPLFDVICDGILRPAGMTDTYSEVPTSALARTVCYDLEHRIIGERYILRTSTPIGTAHDPKAALLSDGGRDLCGHAGLFSTCDDMIRFAQALLGGELLSPQWVHLLGLNRTGIAYTDGAYRQHLGFLCFSKHPDQKKSELPAWMGPSALGLSGFTGNHICIDPVSGVFDLFLGNRVHNRVSTLIPPDGRTQESYGLSGNYAGIFDWSDRSKVYSSVNYVYLKDRYLHNPIAADMVRRGWL